MTTNRLLPPELRALIRAMYLAAWIIGLTLIGCVLLAALALLFTVSDRTGFGPWAAIAIAGASAAVGTLTWWRSNRRSVPPSEACTPTTTRPQECGPGPVKGPNTRTATAAIAQTLPNCATKACRALTNGLLRRDRSRTSQRSTSNSATATSSRRERAMVRKRTTANHPHPTIHITLPPREDLGVRPIPQRTDAVAPLGAGRRTGDVWFQQQVKNRNSHTMVFRLPCSRRPTPGRCGRHHTPGAP